MTAAITVATLTPTISNTGVTKVYDGTTSTALTPTYSFAGLVSGDTAATITNTGKVYNDAHVLSATQITVSGLAITGITGNKSSVASDYVLDASSKTVTAAITSKAITVTGTTATGKNYDGGLGATISTESAVLTNGASASNDNKYYTGDTVVLEKALATGSYATKDVGTNKAVTVTGFTLSGNEAANYTVTDASGATATIRAAIVNIAVTGLAATSRVYDGTTNIALTGTATITIIGSDVVVLGGTPVATIADKAVGVNKPVTVTGSTISGADAGNYHLIQQQGLTATITTKAITVTGTTATGKNYDGGLGATISTASAVLTNGASASNDNKYYTGDTVVLEKALVTGSYATKDVGMNKAVTVTGFTLSGTDAGNYTVTDASGATATITAKDISLVGLTATNKVYDGNVIAAISSYGALSGVVGGDDVEVNSSASTATFTSADAGTAKPVAVHGLTLTGVDAENYNILDQMTTADVTRASTLPPVITNVKTAEITAVKLPSVKSRISNPEDIFVKTEFISVDLFVGKVVAPAAKEGATYSATLISGEALPIWVTFNTKTGSISCAPPVNVKAIDILLAVESVDGKTIRKVLRIEFLGDSATELHAI